MNVNLNEKELGILQCWLLDWAEGERSLYGHINYDDVNQLTIKLDLEAPPGLIELIDGSWVSKMEKLIEEIDKE